MSRTDRCCECRQFVCVDTPWTNKGSFIILRGSLRELPRGRARPGVPTRHCLKRRRRSGFLPRGKE